MLRDLMRLWLNHKTNLHDTKPNRRISVAEVEQIRRRKCRPNEKVEF